MRQLYIRAGIMKMRKQLVVFLVLGFCLAFSCVTAQAQTAFALNVDGCRSGCGRTVSYDTVSLTREGSKDLVTESLNSTCTKEFVATGSPLLFVVEGVTFADFTANRSGFFFSSDVQGGSNTGSIVADTPRLMTPEPASMLLFGSGLLVLGGVLRRRKRKRVPL